MSYYIDLSAAFREFAHILHLAITAAQTTPIGYKSITVQSYLFLELFVVLHRDLSKWLEWQNTEQNMQASLAKTGILKLRGMG